MGEWREKIPNRAAFRPCEAAAASAWGARPEARPTGERARGPERASRGRGPGPPRRRPGRPSWRRRRLPHPHPAQRRLPPLPPLPPPAEAEGPGGGLPQVTASREGRRVRAGERGPGWGAGARPGCPASRAGGRGTCPARPGVLGPPTPRPGLGAPGAMARPDRSAERRGLAGPRGLPRGRARPGIRA